MYTTNLFVFVVVGGHQRVQMKFKKKPNFVEIGQIEGKYFCSRFAISFAVP